MVPLIVIIILIVATMGQAALIASEIETGAAHALMATPVGIGEFFVAKGIGGILMAFGQVLLVLLVIGALAQQTLIVLSLLLLGAILVTGLGFMMGATGWDTPTLMALGFVLMIPLSAPPFDILFPGTVTGWGRLIPTHYLSRALHRTVNLGMGWDHVWQDMAILLAFCVALGVAGILVLRTKFR
jgi:ABC-2 type transport system permease protein